MPLGACTRALHLALALYALALKVEERLNFSSKFFGKVILTSIGLLLMPLATCPQYFEYEHLVLNFLLLMKILPN